MQGWWGRGCDHQTANLWGYFAIRKSRQRLPHWCLMLSAWKTAKKILILRQVPHKTKQKQELLKTQTIPEIPKYISELIRTQADAPFLADGWEYSHSHHPQPVSPTARNFSFKGHENRTLMFEKGLSLFFCCFAILIKILPSQIVLERRKWFINTREGRGNDIPKSSTFGESPTQNSQDQKKKTFNMLANHPRACFTIYV